MRNQYQLTLSALLLILFFPLTHFGQQLGRTVDRQNFSTIEFDKDKLQQKWKFTTRGKVYASPIVKDQILYIGSCDSNFYALEVKTGAVKWAFKTKGEIRSTAVVESGFVYFLSTDGFLYALDQLSGQLKWKFKTEGERFYDAWDYYQSSPAVKDGIVYFGSGDTHIYAINAQDGTLKWKYKTNGIVHASPTLADNAVLVGSFDGFFYCLNADGGLRWKFKTIGEHYFPKGEVQFHGATSDSTVYFGARDFNLYALKIKDGTGHWVYHQPGSWTSVASIAQDKLITTMSDSYSILVSDKTYGNVLHAPYVPLNVFSSASIAHNQAYFGALDGVIYKLSFELGKVIPVFQTEQSKVNKSKFFDATGYLKKDLNEQYQYDIYKVFDSYNTMGSIFSTVWIEEGALFFASVDGSIYALD